jgi:hypothetical protein
VALVPDFDGSGRGALVVGSPFGDWNGFRQGGGALLFGLTSSDGSYVLDGDPELIVGGESEAVDGRLGEWLQVGVARDKTWLLMGGSRADGLGRDQGAAYLVPLLE